MIPPKCLTEDLSIILNNTAAMPESSQSAESEIKLNQYHHCFSKENQTENFSISQGDILNIDCLPLLSLKASNFEYAINTTECQGEEILEPRSYSVTYWSYMVIRSSFM